jgi:hypothetical protein
MAREVKYSGYLSPYLGLIQQMAERGAKKVDIARHLYALGVRSPYGDERYPGEGISRIAPMISVILRKKKKAPHKRTKLVQDWQTWTPEMQEAEFAAGYAR